MPRPKVDPASRRRVARACCYCKVSKQKCDGQTPCSQCVKRKRPEACKRLASDGNKEAARLQPDHASPAFNQAEPSPLGISDVVTSNPSAPATASKDSETASSASRPRGLRARTVVPELLVPRMSATMYDTKGKAVYLGNCATLHFLQNIQQLIADQSNDVFSSLNSDVANLSLMEELPPFELQDMEPHLPSDVGDLKDLIDAFFTSTCGIIDIFDVAQFMSVFRQWINGLIPPKCGTAAVVYLVVALGAQARGSSLLDSRRAQSFYHHGRLIALQELTNDPTLETIQAFLLISMYMLGCSRRNGSYLNLGTAVSAAKSLGLHRDEANVAFSKEEQQLRCRIWKTLRFHDLFFSAMMGRTSVISARESNISHAQHPLPESPSLEFLRAISLEESARAFLIIERIINEVYTKRTVPIALLQSISGELKEWSYRLPAALRTSVNPRHPRESIFLSREVVLRNTHVACSYYFAMMLLMRPFLIAHLKAKSMSSGLGRSAPEERDTDVSPEIYDGAIACIDSAIYTLQLLRELLVADMLFKNMPLAIAWIFVAALVVSSSHFGGIGPEKEIEQAIRNTDELLHCFAANSPQAARYHHIVKRLFKAGVDHQTRLKQRARLSRTTVVAELFRLSPRESTENATDEVSPKDPEEEAVAYQNLWSTPPENELPMYTSKYKGQMTPGASNIAPDRANGQFIGSGGTSLQGGEYPVRRQMPGFVAQTPSLAVHEQEDAGARMANFEHLFSGPIDFGPMLDHNSLMLTGNGNGNENDIFDLHWV